ncbi:hypothetical protein AURDEDRAFT_122512 [Auricularia subglabra TFB-10046 SS5]|nr:hypothetical protein AURDEDRAFT_122512 [Auricularia subglabra TFB-10046 SS5]
MSRRLMPNHIYRARETVRFMYRDELDVTHTLEGVIRGIVTGFNEDSVGVVRSFVAYNIDANYPRAYTTQGPAPGSVAYGVQFAQEQHAIDERNITAVYIGGQWLTRQTVPVPPPPQHHGGPKPPKGGAGAGGKSGWLKRIFKSAP